MAGEGQEDQSEEDFLRPATPWEADFLVGREGPEA